jgi:UDP-glucose 4-epimerase
MVIPRFVEAAINNQTIEIYGDGTQSRVFCHVADATRAILALSASDKTINEVYNVGGIGEISIKDLADKIIKETKSSSTLNFIPYEKAYGAGFEDMQRRVPNIEKIVKSIGWKPEHGLSQIISDVAKSFNN